MNIGRCRLCGKKIPQWKYSNALFCDDYCRKRYYDIKHGRTKPKEAVLRVEGVGKEG